MKKTIKWSSWCLKASISSWCQRATPKIYTRSFKTSQTYCSNWPITTYWEFNCKFWNYCSLSRKLVLNLDKWLSMVRSHLSPIDFTVLSTRWFSEFLKLKHKDSMTFSEWYLRQCVLTKTSGESSPLWGDFYRWLLLMRLILRVLVCWLSMKS